jgi:hypothetical protein
MAQIRSGSGRSRLRIARAVAIPVGEGNFVAVFDRD